MPKSLSESGPESHPKDYFGAELKVNDIVAVLPRNERLPVDICEITNILENKVIWVSGKYLRWTKVLHTDTAETHKIVKLIDASLGRKIPLFDRIPQSDITNYPINIGDFVYGFNFDKIGIFIVENTVTTPSGSYLVESGDDTLDSKMLLVIPQDDQIKFETLPKAWKKQFVTFPNGLTDLEF